MKTEGGGLLWKKKNKATVHTGASRIRT